MSVVDLRTAWTKLQAPTEQATWTATKLSEDARIARTSSNGAAILVRAQAVGKPVVLRTTHVDFHPARELTIRDGDKTETATFSVLEFLDADAELIHHFLRVAETLALEPTKFAAAVEHLFEVFRSLNRAGSRTVQGIWAETLLVAHANDPVFLVRAWHSDPEDLHDFSADGFQLEVKGSLRKLREHEFSLEQLIRSPTTTAVASLLLEEDDMGSSIDDLMDILRPRLPHEEIVRRANEIVAKALGEARRGAESIRFRLRPALDQLRIYSAGEIPRVQGPIPIGVRDVKFRSDLSALLPKIPETTPLLTALLPLDGR